MSEHQIPEPAGPVEHVARSDCPCRPAVFAGWRADGTFGQVVLHRGPTDLYDDPTEGVEDA